MVIGLYKGWALEEDMGGRGAEDGGFERKAATFIHEAL